MYVNWHFCATTLSAGAQVGPQRTTKAMRREYLPVVAGSLPWAALSTDARSPISLPCGEGLPHKRTCNVDVYLIPCKIHARVHRWCFTATCMISCALSSSRCWRRSDALSRFNRTVSCQFPMYLKDLHNWQRKTPPETSSLNLAQKLETSPTTVQVDKSGF